MTRVGIIGASGYTGAELARIICSHPEFEITLATSRKFADRKLAEVFPHLRNLVDIVCDGSTPDTWAEKADVFFTAVPHQTAMDVVPPLLDAGKKVVDLSADFRIHDQATYEEWYVPHSSPQLLEKAVYGLPELYRDKIAGAQLVANPGCYPTSIILGLTPLLEAGAILPSPIISDSKSGTTGAGRGLNLGSLFCEVHDGFRPYKVGRAHRHIPEIEQELTLHAKEKITISFTPHLLPIARGILSTIYTQLTPGFDAAQLQNILEKRYSGERFVRVLPSGQYPATQNVRGSNCCDVAVAFDKVTQRVVVMSAIDNIVKGASGQAIQNMNLMCGLPEGSGLEGAPFFP
ncbi:N-acetyl-gamma-glutamyl-phosphate reductase [Desulforhopalus vacuolatus]|uniref:N-acetyl-gamma-glutamyl-phosphate reductase n=1 Tax=Desulforhopalus vacuolatus TaxID=40414 RepID=UPI00196639A1|nr:N-acetyl-gamma-glutamyl-phosphate reductase [Desulforhopalus vacuolatus]MBM9518679.1 N-acetyl-gamma-glutamyl-phosphate reductase [Desulforhopalus vacuolatus]